MSDKNMKMSRYISTEKTGHQYYGTEMEVYESTDECSTCNGVRCEMCRTKYTVTEYYEDENGNEIDQKVIYTGWDKDVAEQYRDGTYGINEKLQIEYYKIEGSHDHITTIDGSEAPNFAKLFTNLFTHYQIADIKEIINRATKHMEQIADDPRRIAYNEMVQYEIQSMYGPMILYIDTYKDEIETKSIRVDICIGMHDHPDQFASFSMLGSREKSTRKFVHMMRVFDKALTMTHFLTEIGCPQSVRLEAIHKISAVENCGWIIKPGFLSPKLQEQKIQFGEKIIR